jgi:putative acetyltransferase
MSDEISIRALEPGDLPGVAEVLSQPRAIWGTLQSPYISLEARQKRHAGLPPNDRMLVAVSAGKVIGTAGLHTIDNRRRAHVASIGMAVHDDYAGRGVGRALLSAVVDLADRWLHYTRLELTVWADNARAIALYEKAGFEREGLHRAYAWRDGGYVDALCMARLRL